MSKNVTDKKKKRMDSVARRECILRAAARLFSRKGFKGTTTKEIARAADISEAMVFKLFHNKIGLYKAIIDSKCNDKDGESRLVRSLENKEGSDLFRHVASFIIEEHQSDPTFLRLLTFSALEGHELSSMFISMRGMPLIEMLEEHISKLIEHDFFRHVDPAIAARAFLGMVLHYSVSQQIYGLEKYFKRPNIEVVDTFVGIFLDGLRAKNKL